MIIYIIIIYILSKMSQQILLPKDALLKSLAICLDNEGTQIKYQSKPGKVSSRNSETLRSGPIAADVNEILNKVGLIVSEGSKLSVKDISRTILDSNYQTWLFLNDLVGSKNDVPIHYTSEMTTLKSDFLESERICSTRLGNWVSPLSRHKLSDKYKHCFNNFLSLESTSLVLEELRDNYNTGFAKDLQVWKRNGAEGVLEVRDIYGNLKPIKYYQVGSIVIIYLFNKRGVKRCRFMTNVHFSRSIEFLRTFSYLCLCSSSINGLANDGSSIVKVMRKMIDFGISHPNSVGAIFKTARQILFLRGDLDPVMGFTSDRMYISGLEGVKLEYGEKVADFLFELTGNRKSAINLSNVYKASIHPDADMSEVFDSIEGVKEPNSVVNDRLPRFEGVARKVVYSSLIAQKVDVRARAKDPDNEIVSKFVEKINSTSVPISELMKTGWANWSSINFEKPNNFFNSEHQDIPVSNKSSAPQFTIDNKTIRNINAPKSRKQLDEVILKLKSVNDIATVISGESNLEFKSARERFRDVIRQHTLFESKYEGIEIDDIPSCDLEEFVLDNPDASYIVGTEPKLGEVHKEVTRCFYMAEQALKVMTQVCERATKKVISKASGISITKSYRARRKELEEMLSSYTGVYQNNDGEMSVLYVSFDMSEFSKKFPGALVRILGKIMSELTGEDWMERIDVFFRASIVYHNTRGFVGVKAGMRGGFEGFLNFLWTLAMRVVMDVATDATGVEGVLAVYSDDGLLRLFVDGNESSVGSKILTIQKVFKDYGLIFKLDKTSASYNLIEYLGVFGDKGILIPTWIKELTSVGKRKMTPGINVISDKIELWNSQCSSVIKSGGPSDIMMVINTFLTVRTLRRLNRRCSSKVLSILTAVPYSAGGFRVPSITERTSISSMEPLSEFTADLELLYNYNSCFAAAISSTIYTNLSNPKDAERNILSGSLLSTSLIDTSGLGIIRELLSKASIDIPSNSDPLTDKIKETILNSIKTSVNFQPLHLRNLIQEIPDVIEYNKSIAIIKSSAAIKFVDKKYIVMAQKKDTRKCKESISFWIRELESYRGFEVRLNSGDYNERLINKLYPDYKICIPKESARVALTLCEEDPDILTKLEFTADDNINDQTFIEPEAKFLGSQISPEISAESSGSDKQRMKDRFIATAARFVSSNPTMLGLYYVVANSFGLPCPSLSGLSSISSHRSSRNFGKNATSIILPSPYHALIVSRMTNKMWSTLSESERVDRTTYVELAKIGTYLNNVSDVERSYKVKVSSQSLSYKVRNIISNTMNPVFDMYITPKESLIDDHVTRAFTSVIVEEDAQEIAMRSSIMTKNLIESIDDNNIVKAMLLTRLESYIYAVVSSSKSINSTQVPVSIPAQWQTQLYKEAIYRTSYKLINPMMRARLLRNFSSFIEMTAGSSSKDFRSERSVYQHFRTAADKSSDEIREIEGLSHNLAYAMSCMDLTDDLKTKLSEVSLSVDSNIPHFLDVLKRISITGGVICPTVVINTESFSSVGMSRNLKNTIHEAVYSTIQSYTSIVTDKSINGSELGELRRMDQTINFLNVVKNMLRPSGHRRTPFNKHMVMIQFVKIELFIEDFINSGREVFNEYELDDYRLDEDVVKRIKYLNSVIAGFHGPNRGSDMRECLERQGIPSWASSRIKYIVMKQRDKYKSSEVSKLKILQDDNFMVNILNYVLYTFDIVCSESLGRLEIRSSRESSLIMNLNTQSPVEEAMMIKAVCDNNTLKMNEVNWEDIMCYSDYNKLVVNLLNAHYYRWATSGYNADINMNQIIKSHGLFGTSVLSMRSINESPFTPTIVEDDYKLSISSYMDKDSAIHNYLRINLIPGGMAVIFSDEDGESYYIISVLPKNTETINTISTSKPIYTENDSNYVIVFKLSLAMDNLALHSYKLGFSPLAIKGDKEIVSTMLRQAYQRQVGARNIIEDEDYVLISLSQIVEGSWSNDLSLRVLSMFLAWILNVGEPSRRDLQESTASIKYILQYGTAPQRMKIDTAASVVWRWFKNNRISAGPNIDTARVMRMIETLSKNTVIGGTLTVIYNLPSKSINDVKSLKGSLSFDEFINDSVTIMNYYVVQNKELIEDADLYHDDLDEEW